VQLARLASVTGRWAYTITLAVYAYRIGGAGGVALVGIVRLAPAAAVSPFAGTLIRRTRLERLLVAGGLLRTAALVAAGVVVLDGGPAILVYGLAAVESAASTLMRPAQNSLLPALSRTPEELTSTNLALSVIESGGVFLGPLIGAVLLSGGSVGLVLFASAGAYLVSTLLLLPVKVPAVISFEDLGGRRSILQEFTMGTRAIAADSSLRLVVLLYGAQNIVAGALNVLIVVTALKLLGMGQSGVGALTAAVGVGGVLGGALAFSRLRKGHHGTDLRIGLLLWGMPLVLLSFVSSPEAAVVLLGFVGVGVTVVDVASVTLLQRTAKGDLLPHALGVLQTTFVISVATGTLLAPVLVSHLGVRGALLATGAFLPVLAIALNSQLRRLDASSAKDLALVQLLGQISIFAPLPESAIEHLASSLTARAFPAGDVVFSQGDHGDGFYIIESGQVDVLTDGISVATLGSGDYFGEIALLRDVPRTATIQALTDVRLQRLDRARFIGTVTGNSTSSDAADSVVGSRLGLRSGFTTV
jgi:hypothetical protein